MSIPIHNALVADYPFIQEITTIIWGAPNFEVLDENCRDDQII